MTPAGHAAARRAGAAAVAGGLAWLALVPASALQRADDVGHDAYYRVAAVPLVLLSVAWGLFGLAWRPVDLRARVGYALTLAGLALVAVGTALEFWGGWLVGEESGREAGAVTWWGSEVGWRLFLLGVMGLFVGGPTAAVALRRALPFWALALVTLLGLGALSANLFDESPPAVTVPVFGAFAAGWIALGVLMLRTSGAPRPAQPRS